MIKCWIIADIYIKSLLSQYLQSIFSSFFSAIFSDSFLKFVLSNLFIKPKSWSNLLIENIVKYNLLKIKIMSDDSENVTTILFIPS